MEVTSVKKYKSFRKILAALLLVLMLLPVRSYAQGNIDLNRDISLTISYKEENRVIKDAVFHVYLVARANADGSLTTTKAFEQFDKEIQEKNSTALSSTLEGYVLRDEIAPTDSQSTDQEGKAYFQNTLQAGLYLILGERQLQDGKYYDASSSIVMLPAQNNDTNSWDYDVTVHAKYETHTVSQEEEKVTRKVLKVWNDQGHEQERPNEIQVQLLRDGKVFETISLNADNQWRYTWENLDDSYAWKVVEKDSKGYQVSITQEGITFVVTNTYTQEKPETVVPTSGDMKLPQTGQLWWPVPILACAGVTLLIIGLIRKGGNVDET